MWVLLDGKAAGFRLIMAVLAAVLPTAACARPEPDEALLSPSPDAGAVAMIAFTSDRAGGSQIYAMNPDGTGLRELAAGLDGVFGPAFSPDGLRIAFVSWRNDTRRDIYVMDADGTGVTRLTDDPEDDWQPTWSPDGSRIAFEKDNGGQGEIVVMNADGSGQSDPLASGWSPAWSPDGSKIAFSSEVPLPDSAFSGPNGIAGPLEVPVGVFVMNADGTDVAQLTGLGMNAIGPAWSPEGTKIAFGGDGDIWMMDADGSDLTRLTDGPANDSSPAWSPHGTRIAFTSDRDGDSEIFAMVGDGSGVVQLTHSRSEDFGPSWHLVPASIVASMPAPLVDEPPPPEELVGSTCLMSNVTGDFDGQGVLDTALVYVPGPPAICPEDAKVRVSVFLTFDGRIDMPFTECEEEFFCSAIAAPDLDEDGRSELALTVSQGAAFAEFGVYRLTSDGLVGLNVAPPGDPGGRFAPGPVRFQETSFHSTYVDWVTCERGEDGSLLVVQRSADRNGEQDPWTVHETALRLEGGTFVVRSVRDFTLSADSRELDGLLAHGQGIGSAACGSPRA